LSHAALQQDETPSGSPRFVFHLSSSRQNPSVQLFVFDPSLVRRESQSLSRSIEQLTGIPRKGCALTGHLTRRGAEQATASTALFSFFLARRQQGKELMAQAAARIGCRGPGTLTLCSPNEGGCPHSAKGRGCSSDSKQISVLRFLCDAGCSLPARRCLPRLWRAIRLSGRLSALPFAQSPLPLGFLFPTLPAVWLGGLPPKLPKQRKYLQARRNRRAGADERGAAIFSFLATRSRDVGCIVGGKQPTAVRRRAHTR
jgi:hypothetical protein